MVDFNELERSRRKLAREWREQGLWLDISLLDFIEARFRLNPGVESVFVSKHGMKTLTNAERYHQGCQVASALHGIGVGRGDVVAVQLPGWAETAVIYQAIIQLGAVVLPIVNIYGEKEVEYILRQSGARALFMPDAIANTNYSKRYPVYQAIDSLEHVIVLGDDVPAGCIAWSSFKRQAEQLPPAPRPQSIDPDDASLIVYTSGTTSKPKGVRHSHNTLLAEWTNPSFNTEGPYLCCFPMGHYTGFSFIMRPMIADIPSIFLDKWDPEAACELIQAYRVRECGGTPYFLQTLLDAARSIGSDLSSLAWFPMGGTGITPDHIRTAEREGFLGGRVYGSTEHPTVTFSWPDMPFAARGSTDGRVEPGNRVRIVDHHGLNVPRGQDGEILTVGPELFTGYVDADLDRDAFLVGGWFRTGDIGRIDGEGRLTVTGRLKDIIIRGGENISALEVEEYLQSHPRIRESAVVGFADQVYGEKVCAFVTLTEGVALELDDIRAHFAGLGVAKQKTPEKLIVIAEFPRTSSGKIQKFQLLRDWPIAND